MSDTSSNNKRIAKNTLLLYVRMFFVMVISLFTSRIVLNALGVTDYGIYNVVGGVVAMMGVLNGAMSVSTQRYLTYELGRGDRVRLRQTFSMSLSIFVLLSLIVLLLCETVGWWFLNTQLVISGDRMSAANWVYQCSVLSCLSSLFVIPFNATIIAHERMNVYAYIGIFEVVSRLLTAFLLLTLPGDKLILIASLSLLSQLAVMSYYVAYCVRCFEESRYVFYWDKPLFKELVSYSGWNLFGSLAGLVKGQGLNIMLNMFFNPSVNAARGIAYQINAAITQFFTNFYTAVRPQITKYYAQGEQEEMNRLIFRSSRMSFYLILLISMPIIIETPYIVNLWLGQLPEYVVSFTRLIVLISAVDAMSTPLMTAAHATGRIRLYQSSVGTMTLLNIPLSYLSLKAGASPLAVFYISLALSIICLFMRLWIVRRLMVFPVRRYLLDVFVRTVVVSAVSLIPPLLSYVFLTESLGAVIVVCSLSLLSSLASIFYIGLEPDERLFLVNVLKQKIFNK